MKGFLFDLAKCTGCQACTLACTIENELPWGTSWRRIETFNEAAYADVPRYHLSLACNHCDDAACMRVCPAMAYRRDRATGAVILDSGLCVGCHYCSWACPYDAPRFDASRGVMEKCTLCDRRLRESMDPACVASCPTGALRFGDSPARPAVAPGFPETDLGPRLAFDHASSPRAPEGTAPPPAHPFDGSSRPLPVKTDLRSEWALALFTWLASALVGAFTAHAAGALRLPALPFALLTVAGMALSTLHLGRKFRAPRATLHLSSSWLSREIVLFSLFTALAALSILVPSPLPWAAVLAGFAALVAVDRVYDATRVRPPERFHSAGAALTGLFLAGLFTRNAPVALGAGAVKGALYVARKYRERGSMGIGGFAGAILRLLLGFVLPALLWKTGADGASPIVALPVLAGELIDRLEFYGGLRFVTPAAAMKDHLAVRIAGLAGRRAPGRGS